MTMKYLVTLPNLTFVSATKYKLVQFIYALREIRQEAFTYSGPTHTVICSLKYDKADAFCCMNDLFLFLRNIQLIF